MWYLRCAKLYLRFCFVFFVAFEKFIDMGPRYWEETFPCPATGFVYSNIYGSRDDSDFDIVNFPFLDGDIPRARFYGID